MITVFAKELRENLKWALVIFIAMAAMFWHELREAEVQLLFQLARQYTIWLGPVAGLLMGIVQTIFETRPDNWAFVVHRPLSRSRIFLAKSAAGLLLLYVALAVPCLLVTVWAARPGNLAIPFQWRMSLPMLADDLNAGCYYFLGMVLTLRRARWYGTRILPFGLAMLGSIAVTMFTQYFWQALLVVVVVQAVNAIAAWGAFATAGTLDDRPLSRVATAAMMYPGAIGVGIFLAGLTELFYAGGHWQYYQIDQEGNVVLVNQSIEHGERSWSITDISGQRLPKYDNVDLDDPANADLFVRYGAYLIDERAVPWPLNVLYLNKSYRAMTPYDVRLSAIAPPGVRLRFTAYYNVREGLIDLFDPITRLPIGWVGPGGFVSSQSSSAPPAERFPGVPRNLAFQGGARVLAFDSVAYWIELDQRRVRPIFEAQSVDPIFSARDVGPATAPSVMVATRQRLHLLRPSGESLFSIPLDLDPQRHFIQPVLLTKNHHLILDIGSPPGASSEPRRMIREYAEDGTLVRSTQPPVLRTRPSPKLPETALFGAIFPLALQPCTPTWALDEILDIRTVEFGNVFDGFMIGSAIFCALLTLLTARRCGFGAGKTIGWTIANLLLGPAAVVAMLGLHEIPSRETCVSCGEPRLIGRRECTRCGAALPPPALDGREIFEPAEAFQFSV